MASIGHPEPTQYSVAKSFIADTIDTDASAFTVADINIETAVAAITLAVSIFIIAAPVTVTVTNASETCRCLYASCIYMHDSL